MKLGVNHAAGAGLIVQPADLMSHGLPMRQGYPSRTQYRPELHLTFILLLIALTSIVSLK